MIKPDSTETSSLHEEPTLDWGFFRNVCGKVALQRYHSEDEVTHNDYSELRQEPFTNLVAELHVQQEVQRRLALEYANALDGCRRLQERMAHQPASEELDRRLEREVLELAICEEAYELVCEEMEQVRRELARRGASV